KKEKLDAIVLFKKNPGFRYFVQGDYENGLILLSKKANYLFVSPLYAPRFPGFKTVQWKNFKKEFEAFIKKNKIKRVGSDYSNLYVRQKAFLRKHFGVKDASKFLEELRQTKVKEEVSRIRKACRITDSIFKGIITNFRFRTEADVVKFMKIKALEAGAELSFEPIVANAANAIVAHHEAKSRLKKGFLILDFGVKYKGYMSDMTRTLYLGKPGKKETELYNKVLEIQKKCVDKAKVNLKAESLYKYSLKLFGEDAKYFVHGLGHGIGVEIHEKPSLELKSKDILQKNSIFTIEPGYYNKKTGIGIRIEDDVLLYGNKKEILTKSTKKMICIKSK
ncbi:MAG TPA: Xaa-Pro peptidase family protein, partial [Candidatus Nanoarchaeia archaeon]|nr:Xaa-Pro peptidase family protein [Candidatus Nanoarchaeia archaeon]